MELLINKKYLVRLERYSKFGFGGYYNPFAARYVFALPKNAGLPDGYTVYIDAEKVEWEHDEKGIRFNDAKPLYTNELEHDKTYRLDRSSDAVYVAKMTENREEGKRYKQYKYTAEELYSLYQNVNLTSAELAVAKIDIYLEGQEGNRHKMFYGNRIDKTLYLVGKVQGCWFYCSELDTKRRINSHGVTILGKIAAGNEQTARDLIKSTETKLEKCNSYYEDIDDVYRDKDLENLRDNYRIKFYCKNLDANYISRYRYNQYCNAPRDEEVLQALKNLVKTYEETMLVMENKLKERDAELEKILLELEEQLKKIYIKEG